MSDIALQDARSVESRTKSVRTAVRTDLSAEMRRGLLEKHGGFAIAYSVAFQPDMLHFGDENGFLSYKMVGRTAFVLADPIAPFERWESLIDAFIAKFKDVGFWQSSRRTAEILAQRGFFINEFGCLTTLDLEKFSFAGPKRRSFRTARNRLEATGSRIVEASVRQFDPSEVEAVSDGWRRTKVNRHRELRFLVRPVVLADEPGVRKFFLLDSAGRLEAFAFFDPIYEDGKIAGYLSTTRRWLPSADPLAACALVGDAIRTFQAEAVPQLHLGLSPFHGIRDGDLGKNWLVKRVFRLLYTSRFSNRFVYPVQTLARHKESYGGKAEQSFYAFNTLPSLPRLIKLLRACRIV